MRHIGILILFYIAIVLLAGTHPPFLAKAFDASSTNFFIRQDIESINGYAASTSFKVLNGAGQLGVAISNSTTLRIESGHLYTLFKLVRPRYEQIHFHWRNDDGSESGATSATGGTEDTGLANLAKLTTKRLRVEVNNSGGTKFGYSTQQFRIEYALLSGTCGSSTYTDVGGVGGDWDMAASQLTEGGDTTNIAVASGGTTDTNNTFLTPNGGQRETASQTGALSLASNNFTELEYAMQATAAATAGGTYCFRVTNAGATTDFLYTRYATTTISAGGNNTPTVSAVTLNHGNPITLTPNATTSLDINFTVTDNDGCSDVFSSGNVTSTAFRSGVGISCSASDLNCYKVSTVTHNCVAGTSANATATVGVYYFANASDSSSTFPSENWQAYVTARDAAGAVGSSTSSGVELNTLLSINVTPTTIVYGTVTAGTNTGSTNQAETVQNTGNASTTLQISGTALSLGGSSIATSSQHYATGTFTFGGVEQVLSSIATAISGFLLTSPTSTGAVQQNTYWGITIPGGSATGTYSGTNTFTAIFNP